MQVENALSQNAYKFPWPRIQDRRKQTPKAVNASHETIVESDGVPRPRWTIGSAKTRAYYDQVWGFAKFDELSVFQALCFAVLQAGISIRVVCSRWQAMCELLDNFHPDYVAKLSEIDVQALLGNPAILRNPLKLAALVHNAKATIALRTQGGLARLVWQFQPDFTPTPRTKEEVPRETPESRALAANLRKHGFIYVGSVMSLFLMSSIGVIDISLMDASARGRSGLWHPDGSSKIRGLTQIID